MSNLVFYAQSTITVISERERERDVKMLCMNNSDLQCDFVSPVPEETTKDE